MATCFEKGQLARVICARLAPAVAVLCNRRIFSLSGLLATVCMWTRRLAPLSEGRIEPSDGTLQCSYHGAPCALQMCWCHAGCGRLQLKQKHTYHYVLGM